MSLSEYLQEYDVLNTGSGSGPGALKQAVVRRGCEWFDKNPDEKSIIRENLSAFGLDSGSDAVRRVIDNLLLHYYEKLIPFCLDAKEYYDYVRERVVAGDGPGLITAAREQGKAVVLATAHFGAIELIAPFLAAARLPVVPVLRFKTQHLSDMARDRAAEMESSGRFALVRFIEIGRPGTVAAMEMAAALRRKDILISMIDENTGYSIPVSLLNRKIAGGAGLDRVLNYAGASVAVFSASMVREGDEHYRFVLSPVAENSITPVQDLFDILGQTVKLHPEQWYFLHENITFFDT
ncbi:MAG: hypothetical protein GF350_01535 [Chitinivibrionales bacterium]|nr:hypothetical protein [Chitinivibrionales bacterium]